MGKITFILGGARSGKSSYAIQLAKESGSKVAFVATCSPRDGEMRKRIENHKRCRPSQWATFEEFKELSVLLKKIGSKFNLVIVDCLTLFISNLLLEGYDNAAIVDSVNRMIKTLQSLKCKSVIVANEVGLGIVPENSLARRFRDLAGKINQLLGRKADEVFFMVAGLPLKIK